MINVPMKYYVNKNAQSNWDHEVHKSDCSRLKLIALEDRKYLWDFDNCRDAVREAKRYYSAADGCYHCSPSCHTS